MLARPQTLNTVGLRPRDLKYGSLGELFPIYEVELLSWNVMSSKIIFIVPVSSCCVKAREVLAKSILSFYSSTMSSYFSRSTF